MKYRTLFLLLLLLLMSCKKDENINVSPLVINELMAKNTKTAMDLDGEFDDWIELYNNSSALIDLSTYYLTDSKDNLSKWKFPAGATIPARAYLIVWADKDTTQIGFHANFKLSPDGEKVFLVNSKLKIVNEVEYEAQTMELSWSRVPNATGSFSWKIPSFEKRN